ncbi:MAG: type III pantothenate kinase [Tannerella sp.]|nr:type III pantothenate kinase [Tannerella sp.]
MNLIVEQGNTKLKVAVFDGNAIERLFIEENGDLQRIKTIIGQYRPEKGIISSVIGHDELIISLLSERLSSFILLDEHVSTPIIIDYATRDTLGNDRVAAAVGANYLQPGKNLLVIDAGTAITYEVVEASGTYKGGNISPGMTTRFKALNRFTKQLPLVKESDSVPVIGTSTESAILAGVVNGIVYEMDGYIDMMKERYDDVFVFLTGGHSFYFEKRLKSRTFADANLVLIGLNRILEYNAEKY